MKRWQTFVIVWALLEVTSAVRSLHPNPSEIYGWASLSLGVSALVMLLAAAATFKDKT